MKKRLLIGFIVLLTLDLVITIMYFLFSIKPVKIPYLFFVLFVLGIKESGFDPFCAAILPFPIITISWIVAEYRGEE